MSSICFYVSLKCNSIEKTPDKCYDNSNLEKKHLKGRGQKQERLAFCLGGTANYKALWLCGFNKASQRAWSRVWFGVRRMWVVSFSVHKQAVSVHPCMPEYTHGRIVAATSTNKLFSLLSHFSSRHVLSAPFSGCHRLLFASATKKVHLTIFKRHHRGICTLYVFCAWYFCVTHESTSSLYYNIV